MARTVKIGHTSITWQNADIEDAAMYLSKLGYAGIETFGSVLQTLDAEGRSDVFGRYAIPLVSTYCSVEIADASKWDASAAQLDIYAGLMGKHNCKIVVLGGSQIDRRAYNFAESKATVIRSINEIGKRLADKGILCCFHPHTGTPVQTEEEIRTVMDAVDGKYVAFAPDVGQIQKGGTDALAIVKDYYPLLKHMHFKDYIGGALEFDGEGKEIDKSGYLGYTALGEGVVDLKGILDLLEERGFAGYCMVELDGRHYGKTDYSLDDVHDSVMKNKLYLEKMGYAFK
ncbi:MAG: sugar phosphate isomerase/epimerase [Oscillospiraceae bacterium]|jgi:inosose dehydratase|nr:sugar phosphate isomerase/epimerase [Oscillospiraceae bacterium]